MAKAPQEYTGTWIPAIIMLNEKLKPMDKLLYAEIASFIQCFASNKWLAERLGISERSVQTAVAKLKDMRLITVFETEKHQRICVAATQNLHPPTQNLRTPHAKSAIKNNNKNTNKELHTSELRPDHGKGDSSEGAENQDSSREAAARAATLEKIFWVLIGILHPGQKILFTDKRKGHLKKRLETFKPSELVNAAQNLMQDPWNTGQNPQKVKYADFDFLTRSDEQVEKWLNRASVEQKKPVF